MNTEKSLYDQIKDGEVTKVVNNKRGVSKEIRLYFNDLPDYPIMVLFEDGTCERYTKDGHYEFCGEDPDEYIRPYTEDKVPYSEETELDKKQKTVHQLMLEHLNLRPGDRVRILRKAETLELGWDSVWLPEMNQFVGKVLEVVAVRGEYGVHCEDFLFPAHVLEVCSRDNMQRKVQLSEHCYATVSEKGITVLGCLITREKFLELHAAAKEVGFIS